MDDLVAIRDVVTIGIGIERISEVVLGLGLVSDAISIAVFECGRSMGHSEGGAHDDETDDE